MYIYTYIYMMRDTYGGCSPMTIFSFCELIREGLISTFKANSERGMCVCLCVYMYIYICIYIYVCVCTYGPV